MKAEKPLVISRGTEEMSGNDLDSEADPLKNPDIYENTAPVTTAERPLPEEEPSLPERETPAPVLAPERALRAERDEPVWTSDQMREWDNLRVAREGFPDEYAGALAECGLTEADVTPGVAGEIIHAISRTLDREGGDV